MYPPIVEYLREKTVLLVGFGREGQSSYQYIRRFLPEKPLTIADQNPVHLPDDPFTTCICGTDYLANVNRFDLVLKSPGISFKDVAVAASVEVTCQVDLFLRFAPGHKIGITGSKGKTTTATLTHLFLKARGRDSRLIGNIGVPVWDTLDSLLPETISVIEMSSHQLEFTRCSPEIAVLTNLYEEHLEHYRGGFAGYAQAKSHIALYQQAGDLLLYNADQGLGNFPQFAALPSEKRGIHAQDALPFAIDNMHLAGIHNRQDVLFARAAVQRFGVSDEAISLAVQAFAGIEHRMENVGTFCGITFYNDCIATIPHAVLCAVDALQRVDTLIVGGKDRGLHYGDFVDALAVSGISNIIGTPETGHAIVQALQRKAPAKNAVAAADLDEAVRLAFACTEKGKICLLSPAASSYNVYKNFEEKGIHYKQLIQKYGASSQENPASQL